jgi:hypothetical protein
MDVLWGSDDEDDDATEGGGFPLESGLTIMRVNDAGTPILKNKMVSIILH